MIWVTPVVTWHRPHISTEGQVFSLFSYTPLLPGLFTRVFTGWLAFLWHDDGFLARPRCGRGPTACGGNDAECGCVCVPQFSLHQYPPTHAVTTRMISLAHTMLLLPLYFVPQVRKALVSFPPCPGVADQKKGTCGCDGPQHVMTLNQLDKVLKAQDEAVWKAVCHGKTYENGLAPLVATCLGQELFLRQRRINKVNSFNQILGVCDCVPTLVHIKVLTCVLVCVLAENVHRRPQRG